MPNRGMPTCQHDLGEADALLSAAGPAVSVHPVRGQGTITAEKMRRLDRADGPGGQRLLLQSMIRHHQGAVAMAETEIAEGKHPAAIQLAETIAERQQRGIETMQELLTKI